MRALPALCPALYLALALSACGGKPPVTEGVSLPGLRGQWVLVNYWAQWCKPCIEEIPELNEFDHSRADVTVLGVNFEGVTGDDLAQQEGKLGVEFPTIPDPSASLGIPRPVVLPTTLLIDPEGAYVDKLLGPQTEATLAQAISEAKKSRP